MRIIRGFENLPKIKNPVITIGSFDGVHRGHRLLIEQLKEVAERAEGESVVITFDPHPRELLRGNNRLLTTLDEKCQLMAQTGIENIIVIAFTRSFSQLSHTEFVEEYLINRLQTKCMLTGKEHNFGRGGRGTLDTIRQYSIETVRLERYDNISSTMIRDCIEQGRIKEAAELLGDEGYLIKTPLRNISKLLPSEGKYRVEIEGRISDIFLDRTFFEQSECDIIIKSEL